jgi:hypothetical protein
MAHQHRRAQAVEVPRSQWSKRPQTAAIRLSLLLADESGRHQAMQVAERYADGLATEKKREAAYKKADRERNSRLYWSQSTAPAMVACLALGPKVLNPRAAATKAQFTVAMDEMNKHPGTRRGWPLEDPEFVALMDLERKNYQVPILRDIFGNPFRPVTIDPSWLTSTVKQLAQAIYTDLVFERLPILSDALEDAGCNNQDILNHCRQPADHVRGCWVVDLLLGKE